MSEVTARTFILYGTKVDFGKFDTSRFENAEEYINHVYDVINKVDSPFQMIYDELSDSHYFGYVIDQAADTEWETELLNTVSFSDLKDKVTTDIRESVDWILLVYFGRRASEFNVDLWILSVYA